MRFLQEGCRCNFKEWSVREAPRYELHPLGTTEYLLLLFVLQSTRVVLS